MSSDKKIGVAVIAAGSRGTHVTENLLRDSGRNVKVVAVYDQNSEFAGRALEKWGEPDAKICDSYLDAINTAGVDWVMIFSPNSFHKEHILAAFAAGKNVFTEKPLATSIQDCQEIYAAHQRANVLFATGFVLRYAPIYRKVKEVLVSGILGKILSIDANENITPGHGGYIMMNWRRHSRMSGPHILEKCVHDIDLLNWFTGSLPNRIAAFGGLDFYIPENQHLQDENVADTFSAWPDHTRDCDSPFMSDKDIMDNQVAIMQYRNGAKVMFQATMSNAIPERRMYFSCSEGNLIVELYSSTLKYRRLGDASETVLDFGADGHGGGDSVIMKELFECMCTNREPQCSGDEGLESAVIALSIDQAITSRTIIDLEPIWYKLDR